MLAVIKQFYSFSRRRFLFGAGIAAAILLLDLVLGFPLKAGLVLGAAALCAGGGTIVLPQRRWTGWIYVGLIFLASGADVVCMQVIMNAGFGDLSPGRILLNIFCVAVIIGIVFLITLNFRVSVISGMVPPLLFATVDYYIYLFRGNELEPLDLLSLGTALNVAGSYHFYPESVVFYGWVLALLFVFACFALPNRVFSGMRVRILTAAAEAAMIAAVVAGVCIVTPKSWHNQSAIDNGALFGFLTHLKECFVEKPEEYSADLIAQYELEYEAETAAGGETPTVIAIMSESFADLSVLGSELSTNIAVTPFLDSLTENTLRGYALASVYGANTPNSEYEFLTGNTMAFLPTNSIVYQQYLKSETASLVSALKSLGYTATATHPYYSSGWQRTRVYPLLQFDSYSFLDDYPQLDLIRYYVSDQEMFEYIVASYEARDTETPFFLFGVSMQNHGGYLYEEEDFENTVQLIGYEGDYPKAEQYLTLLHETDAALEYLISWFSAVEEPVVIVFFGDHLPSLEMEFYEELHGGSFSTLEEKLLLYTVPFFIWANYDIEAQEVELTSLNYLSTYVMEVAGLEKTPYQLFLTELRERIPAINSQGYYSVAAGGFLSVSDAEGEEAQLLLKYWQLEYNSLFDTTNRSTVFFSVTD